MPNRSIELVKYLSRLSQLDVESVGAYAHSLSMLLTSGVPIPQSIIVTKEALNYFLEFAGIKKVLSDALKSQHANLRRIERAVLDAAIPPVLKASLEEGYHRISGFTDSYVLVQPLMFTLNSSSPLKQEKQKIALGINGLLDCLKRAWAEALCNPGGDLKAILENRESISVLIEKLPLEEVSGTMNTSDNVTNHTENLLIEAVYGMLEVIEKEDITPDQYIFSKKSGKITDKHLSKQPVMLIRQLFRDKAALEKVTVSSIWQTLQKLNDKYIEHLAEIGKLIEEYYKSPCEIKWVYEAGKLWIISIDPSEKALFTAEARKLKGSAQTDEQIDLTAGLKGETVPRKPKLWAKTIKTKEIAGRGHGNFAGYVEGIARKSISGIVKGEKTILVVANGASVTDEALQNISGLVLDQGTTQEPIVIRTNMLGIPTVIGTGIASRMIKDGESVWIDAVKGTVYSTSRKQASKDRKLPREPIHDWAKAITADRSATKIFIGIDTPTYSQLLRAETFAAYTDGALISLGKAKPEEQIASFAKTFYIEGKPTILAVNSNAELENASKYLLALRNSETIKSIWLALPPYKDQEALIEQKHLLLDIGLRRSSTFKIFANIRTPSGLFTDSALFETGIDGIIIEAEPVQKALSGRSANKLLSETVKPLGDFTGRASKKDIEVFINLGSLSVTRPVLEMLISSGVYGLVTADPDYFPKLRNLASQIEHSIIAKRGTLKQPPRRRLKLPNRRVNKKG